MATLPPSALPPSGLSAFADAPHPEATPQGDPAERVLRRFRVVFNAVKSHFQQVEKQAGLGGAQVWALSVIQAHPGIGVNGLAREMDIHQTTASNLVRALTGEGLVHAEKKGADKRTVQLRLLPPGAEVLARTPGPFTGVLPQALARLDPATLRRLDHDLATLILAVQADAPPPAPLRER